jgi:aminoglycoside 6'-N-acetyltransferase I
MKVRPASEEDFAGWLPLRMALWPHGAEQDHLREMRDLLISDGIVLLAEDDDGRVSGFAELSVRREYVDGPRTSPVAYLEGWQVVPEKRGHGIGRALVEAAEAWAVAQGFTELASDAEIGNEEGIRAHLKLGFRETGRTVHFVRDLGTAG